MKVPAPTDAGRRQPSLTARVTCLMRALHTKYDRPALIRDDWADRLIPDDERQEFATILLDRMPPGDREHMTSASADTILHAAWLRTSVYAGVVIRTRYTEDTVAAAVDRGIRQYVVLGAGFDSFAMRHSQSMRELDVFEVDHPASQEFKRSRLAATGVTIPSTLHFVPAVLGEDDLRAALATTSFRFDEPAIFSWLGVTMYLTREANLATLRSIAQFAPSGTDLVFTYITQDGLDSNATAMRWAKSAVRSVGESWQSGFDPTTLGDLLRRCGFGLLDDLGSREQRARYCEGRADGFAAGGPGRIAWARVL